MRCRWDDGGSGEEWQDLWRRREGYCGPGEEHRASTSYVTHH